MFDKLIRKCLALCIRCPKKPKTKGDVLRYALRWYLHSNDCGLCCAIDRATYHFQYKSNIIGYGYNNVSLMFPLFCYKIAVEEFDASGPKGSYWWPIRNWRIRYRFMKWLIKEYDNVKL